MFITESIKKDDATGELKSIYTMIEKGLGYVPEHFELFGAIDVEMLKGFIKYNLYFKRHKKIDANLLPYLRLCIAQRECRNYCIRLNTKMLLSTGTDKNILSDIIENIDKIPFSNEQKLLLKKVLKAIYEAEKFTKDDLKELYQSGFNNKDFVELLNYGIDFMGKSRMIEVFTK
jgi:hypothetical protein